MDMEEMGQFCGTFVEEAVFNMYVGIFANMGVVALWAYIWVIYWL